MGSFLYAYVDVTTVNFFRKQSNDFHKRRCDARNGMMNLFCQRVVFPLQVISIFRSECASYMHSVKSINIMYWVVMCPIHCFISYQMILTVAMILLFFNDMGCKVVISETKCFFFNFSFRMPDNYIILQCIIEIW